MIDRIWKEFERGPFIHTPSAQQDDWEGKKEGRRRKGEKKTELN